MRVGNAVGAMGNARRGKVDRFNRPVFAHNRGTRRTPGNLMHAGECQENSAEIGQYMATIFNLLIAERDFFWD